jgi:hypothetical protein
MPPTTEIHSAIPDLPIRIIRRNFQVPLPPGSQEPPRSRTDEMVEYTVPMPNFKSEMVALPVTVMGDSAAGVVLKLCLERYDSLRAMLTQIAKERDDFAQKWDDVCHERDDLKIQLEDVARSSKKR